MDSIGRKRFAGYSCDSTKNTKGSRYELIKEVPTIIDLPDPVHHTHNTIGEICSLEYFAKVCVLICEISLCLLIFIQTILVLRSILNHFSHSDKDLDILAKACEQLDISHGLEKIGNTWFGSIIISAQSVQCNMPALLQTVSDNQIRFEVCKTPCS
jgi:hypothetical protein